MAMKININPKRTALSLLVIITVLAIGNFVGLWAEYIMGGNYGIGPNVPSQ